METKEGTEMAAIQILTKAIQLDKSKKFSESLTCYEQGITLLMKASKGNIFFFVFLFIADKTL